MTRPSAVTESRVALGIYINLIAVGNTSKKKTLIQSPNDCEWVSIVEAVSALGRSIRPLVIFKGKHIQTSWFHHDKVPDWVYTTLKNGWIANRIAFNWLTKVFIPEQIVFEKERFVYRFYRLNSGLSALFRKRSLTD